MVNSKMGWLTEQVLSYLKILIDSKGTSSKASIKV